MSICNLSDLLGEIEFHHDDDFLTLSESDGNAISAAIGKDLVTEFGGTFNNGRYEFTFNELPFVEWNINTLIKMLISNRKYNYDSVYIVSQKRSITVNDALSKLHAWIDLFELLSDKTLTESEVDSFLVINSLSERHSSEIFDMNTLPLLDDSEIEFLLENITSPETLTNIVKSDDAHQSVRVSMAKKSLIDIFQFRFDSKLHSLMCNASTLIQEYQKDYEVYLRSFSFKDFHEKIDEEIRGIIEKSGDQVHAFQMQAFAVPGVIILASALRAAESQYSLALVFGVILALLLLLHSYSVKKEFINESANFTISNLKIYKSRLTTETSAIDHPLIEVIDRSIDRVKKVRDRSFCGINTATCIIITVLILYFTAQNIR